MRKKPHLLQNMLCVTQCWCTYLKSWGMPYSCCLSLRGNFNFCENIFLWSKERSRPETHGQEATIHSWNKEIFCQSKHFESTFLYSRGLCCWKVNKLLDIMRIEDYGNSRRRYNWEREADMIIFISTEGLKDQKAHLCTYLFYDFVNNIEKILSISYLGKVAHFVCLWWIWPFLVNLCKLSGTPTLRD